MSRIHVVPGFAALAVACTALATVAGAVLAGSPAGAVAAVSAAHAPPAVAAASTPPSPSASTCPGGEPEPCPASSKDRDQVDAERDQVDKATQQAKADMGVAKGQATACPPTSKQCMTDLAGDGKAEKDGMAKAQQGLDGVQPAPSDNAAAALRGECGAFAAQLPPALASSGDTASNRVCELMNQ